MNSELLDRLRQSKKYRDVCPDTLRRIIAECEGRYKGNKALEKAVREKLHGITSAFMSDAEYKRAQRLADEWSQGDDALEALLCCHASTRERLPLAAMDKLYRQIFEITGTPASLLDLACGINPAYLLARYPDMRVTGVDISGQSINIISRCGGSAAQGDLLCENAVPAQRFDLALLFKILPLLDRQRSGAAMDVLNAVNAAHIVVSFPTRTLGGRNVGMEENYSVWMEGHLPEKCEIAAKFATENELFYILKEK